MHLYDVHITRADGSEFTVRKRGHNRGDALARAVAKYPRCKQAWVWLDWCAKAVLFGSDGRPR